MLKHGRAGVPMEVMGLMLGEFVDDYTVRVIDVFAMPQSGTVSYIYVLTAFDCHCIVWESIYCWFDPMDQQFDLILPQKFLCLISILKLKPKIKLQTLSGYRDFLEYF